MVFTACVSMGGQRSLMESPGKQEIKPFRRRSARIPRRLPIVLRWNTVEGDFREELAETLLLSRYGGLALGPARIKAGEEVFLWWPAGQREAVVRIVFRQIGGPERMAELAFEFVDVDNFWEVDFPADTSAWGSGLQ